MTVNISNARTAFVDSDGVLTKFGKDVLTKLSGVKLIVVNEDYEIRSPNAVIVCDDRATDDPRYPSPARVDLHPSPKDGYTAIVKGSSQGFTVRGNGNTINDSTVEVVAGRYYSQSYIYSFEKDTWYTIG